MKKVLFIIGLSVFLYSHVSAQGLKNDSAFYKSHFYINPFDLFFSNFQVTLERDVHPNKNSIAINTGVFLQKTDSKIETGFNMELQYRINIYNFNTSTGGFMSNLFFAPYGLFKYKKFKDLLDRTYTTHIYNYSTGSYYTVQGSEPKRDATLNGIGAGLLMGIRSTAFNNRFCIAAYGGGGLKFTEVTGYANTFDSGIIGDYYTGVVPRFGFQIGLSF